MEDTLRGNDLASRLSGFVHKPEIEETSLETDISDEIFDNTPLSDFDTSNVRTNSIRPLFRSKPEPRVFLQKEQAWHRTAAHLHVKRMTRSEIARALGKSEQAVTLLAAQPFFAQICAEIVAEQADSLGEDALSILRTASTQAAIVLTNLALNSKSDAVKLQASKEVLDRTFGKSPVTVRQEAVSRSLDPSKEAQTLLADIQRLQTSLKTTLPSSQTS